MPKKKTTKKKTTAVAKQEQPKRRRGPSPKLKKAEAALEKSKKTTRGLRKKLKEAKESRGNVMVNAGAGVGGAVGGSIISAGISRTARHLLSNPETAEIPAEAGPVVRALTNPATASILPAVIGGAMAAFSKSAPLAHAGIGMVQPLVVHGVEWVADEIQGMAGKSSKSSRPAGVSPAPKQLGSPRRGRSHYRELGAPPPRRHARQVPGGRLEAGVYSREEDFIPQGM